MSYDEFLRGLAMSVAPARVAAYEVVRRVFEEEAYADRVLRGAAEGLDARDRALAQRLAYGTVQRVRTLDHALEAIGRRPVAKLDAPVRTALRLGAYQLGYLDSVPRHAAVNESVELVRRAGLERAVPFANAVMRRLALELSDVLAALPEGTPEEAALKHSYPDWVAETWWRELGAEEARALMVAQNELAGDRRAARPRHGRGRADRHPRRVPRLEGRRAGARRGPDLAAEPRLAARRALRRRAGGRADARSLRGAGRQGDDARGRGDGGRAPSRARARAGGERAAARRDRT